MAFEKPGTYMCETIDNNKFSSYNKRIVEQYPELPNMHLHFCTLNTLLISTFIIFGNFKSNNKLLYI